MKEVVLKNISELVPYENNARTHSDEQIKQIADSIEKFGFVNPVLIDNNNGIIAGHGRVLGAKKLKMRKVPCLVIDDLNEDQKRAYILADNQIALNAGWDEEILRIELEELKANNFDIGFLNFDLEEIKIEEEEEEPEKVEDEEINTESNFNYKEQYGVIVMCKDESDQEKVYNQLSEAGYECKVVNT